MKLDIKTVIVLATLLFTGAGFYYTTQNRLDDLETDILFLNRQLGDVQKQAKRLNRLVLRANQQGDNK
tara:strand:+ start:2111 stop:2314 length:204 start_codon:yes stop_codon:yes gene_type:complete